MRFPIRRRRQRRTLINSPLARWPFVIVAALDAGIYLIAAACAAIAWAAWTPRPRTTRRTR